MRIVIWWEKYLQKLNTEEYKVQCHNNKNIFFFTLVI